MYEVEVKVPADLDVVRDRLDRLGFEANRSLTQVDVYYDAPHRSFGETDEALRIRRELTADETVVNVTYKGPLVDDESKTREEFETSVDSDSELAEIFERLGFTPTATVRKERTVYDVEGYAVTLDVVADVGEYVEVERGTTESDVEAVRRGAFDVLDRLGLDPTDQIRTSYLGLLLDDGIETDGPSE
ncbi:class IV adenylate cyclase [Halovivax cerinus]|uniref:Class IV adenylate cyclase n=1 Tax=Halovivax cerinus TaxID=1487865 RepID=A0ABD5NSI4_9EURY|nr:class IV adenylate cyclase [Halovivax cerinus]